MIPRPNYVGEDWLKHSCGFAFAEQPPAELLDDRYLQSPSPWERVVCVTRQAQEGDFRNLRALLHVANATTDVHLGVSALRVFAHAAPSSVLPEIASVFDHSNYDIRIESITAPAVSCDLAVVAPLTRLLPHRRGEEREYLSTTLWDLLDPSRDEDSVLIELDHDADAQTAAVERLTRRFTERYEAETALLWGAPLELPVLMEHVRALCMRNDYQDMGGVADDLMAIFEAMTGIPRRGCSTADCAPVPREIAKIFNRFEQDDGARRFAPGQRYFFGHRIPR